ncbi:MAG: pentapeptide repeat-containing protein, partial [Microcystaceae cyanobacterium]
MTHSLLSLSAEELLTRYRNGDRQFVGVNLRDVDLLQVDLTEIDLSGSDLRQARLGKSHLKRANLQRANFSEALMWGTDLESAHLKQ